MSYGSQIRELRKKHSLSQEQLAEQIGVARQTISKWELDETAPDIKQAKLLSEIFNVSLDELLGYAAKETAHNSAPTSTNSNKPRNKIIAISVAAVLLCLVAIGAFSAVRRSQILHPDGAGEAVSIVRKDPVHIEQHTSKTVVFCEENKPAVICLLPEGFLADPERPGFYTDEDGNFIWFRGEYADAVINPLVGTPYYTHYAERGYDSYIEMAKAAMYYDPPALGILASMEELYLAGGAKLIRAQLCAGQDADYYAVSGELTATGGEMLMHGFALHFSGDVWQIVLRDYEDHYYFLTIKDPSGVGQSIDTVAEFIGYIYAGDAAQYSNALDSSAMQEARNAMMEYTIAHNSADGCFVYQADGSRFVSIHDGSILGVCSNIEAALSAMIENPDPSKLTATGYDNLWVYK